jgi:predicted RNase H-like HicB family nuclease
MEAKRHCYIIVTHVISKEDKIYVANCPELGVASQGITIGRANLNLKEAVSLYIDGLKESGAIIEVLKEKNVKLLKAIPKEKEEIKISTELNHFATVISESIPVFC